MNAWRILRPPLAAGTVLVGQLAHAILRDDLPTFEVRLTRLDGGVVHALSGAAAVQYEGMRHMLIFMRDISDEVETRRDLMATSTSVPTALAESGR